MQTFKIIYRLSLHEGESIDQKVDDICIEQSVELPRGVLSEYIANEMVGQPVSRKQIAEDVYEVIIKWPVRNIGNEITTFLNILYGNISLKPGIEVTNLSWDELPEDLFPGPAFGINRLREIYAIPDRPVSATALKPLGSSPQELGELCYRFAKGGIDIIKDDHNLANQTAAPFTERVQACVKAVKKAADDTGRRARYYPHITAPVPQLFEQYQWAAEMGADGVLLCPHICGLSAMRKLRETDISLPIIAHPAFSGALVMHEGEGFTPAFLYGQLWRALGADFVIYTNVGGRFSFSREVCEAINNTARSASLPFKPSFPMPGGGLKRDDINKWKNAYGRDTVFLMGGSLYNHPEGIEQAAREFSTMLKHA